MNKEEVKFNLNNNKHFYLNNLLLLFNIILFYCSLSMTLLLKILYKDEIRINDYEIIIFLILKSNSYAIHFQLNSNNLA